jgi:hypothetical protein
VPNPRQYAKRFRQMYDVFYATGCGTLSAAIPLLLHPI